MGFSQKHRTDLPYPAFPTDEVVILVKPDIHLPESKIPPGTAPSTVRLLTVLVKVTVIAIGLGLTIGLTLLMHIADLQNTQAKESSISLYQGLTTLQAKQMASHVRDYTNWDDAIENLIKKPNGEWWENNAGDYARQSFGLSFSMMLDGSGRPRFLATGEMEAGPDPAAIRISPSMAALVAKAQRLPLSAPATNSVAIGIVEYDDTLHLAAAVRFSPEEDDSPPNPDQLAVLIFARSIRDDLLSEAGKIMGVHDLGISDNPLGGNAAVPLVLADATPGGLVAWTQPRPGRFLTSGMTWITVIGGLCIIVLAVFFFLWARRLAQKLNADERARWELAARNDSILQAAGEGVFGVDAQGITIFVNRAALQILGREEDMFIGCDPCLLIFPAPDDQKPTTECPIKSVLQRAVPHNSDTDNFLRKDGSPFPVEYSINPVMEGSLVTGAVIVFHDITRRKQAEEEIAYRANYDGITGLANRNLLYECLGHELKIAHRENMQVGLLLLDLDHFKNINDTLGHQMGDLLLQQVATRLRSCVRNSDMLSRLGGDEFVIMLSRLNESNGAALTAEKVLAALSQPFTLSGQEAWVGASIGITVYPADGKNLTELMRNADMAMYRAKEMGRSTYCFFQTSMKDLALQRRSVEVELRRALAENELRLHYQPIVNLDTGRPIAFEALVRWQHPEQGLLAPDKFIGVAEATGLIVELGEWVLRESCRQIASWQIMGFTVEISVNVSAKQLPRGLPVDLIQAICDEYGVAPQRLKLEITETVILDAAMPVIEWLDVVRALGVRLVLDDFGTGYSSLSYLKSLAPDTLKIDRSFITGLPGDTEDEAVVTAIMAMAQGLNLMVVAEGIETEEQQAWLLRHGCRYGQGYLFGKPVEAKAMESLLHQGQAQSG